MKKEKPKEVKIVDTIVFTQESATAEEQGRLMNTTLLEIRDLLKKIAYK